MFFLFFYLIVFIKFFFYLLIISYISIPLIFFMSFQKRIYRKNHFAHITGVTGTLANKMYLLNSHSQFL